MEKDDEDATESKPRYWTKVCSIVFMILLVNYLFISHFFPISSSRLTSKTVTSRSSEWPFTPFHTYQTEIRNVLNEPVTLVGINWPGHGLPMVPEGLQYQSIADIVAKVKDLGMNVVRLTYATEMVDNVYQNEMMDLGLKDSFVKALGPENGTRIYEQVTKLNPELSGANITRLAVFDAVAKELTKQKIYLHLDNHISKAGWCCSPVDGNGFFGDTYFNTTNWVRGLKYMTQHASQHWPSFISTSLRNELRNAPINTEVLATYNWTTWYDNVMPAIHAVHDANANPLIFVSGMDYDRTLQPVINGLDLGNGRKFDLQALDSDLREKIVWEIHNYNNSISSCELLTQQLNDGGYSILTPPSTPQLPELTSSVNVAPLLLTEFGFSQDSSGVNSVYAQCLSSHLRSLRGGWMYWVLVGSYYERQGTQDYDESWGILSHDWSSWRDQGIVDGYFRGLVSGVLRSGGDR